MILVSELQLKKISGNKPEKFQATELPKENQVNKDNLNKFFPFHEGI